MAAVEQALLFHMQTESNTVNVHRYELAINARDIQPNVEKRRSDSTIHVFQ
jgi:hypothetical protein